MTYDSPKIDTQTIKTSTKMMLKNKDRQNTTKGPVSTKILN